MAIREEVTRIMPLPGAIQVKFNDGRCTILIDGEPYAYHHMTAKDVQIEIGPDRIPRLHVALMAKTVMVAYEDGDAAAKTSWSAPGYDKFGYPMGEEYDYGPQFGEEEDE